MVDRAERIGNPVLSPVTDQQQVARAELGAALRARASFVEPSRLERRLQPTAGLPVRALDRPRNQVLEAAEDRPAIAFAIAEPKAVAPLDLVPAPRAAELCRSR